MTVLLVRLATADDVPLLAPIEKEAGERFRSVPGFEFVADHDPSFAPEVLSAAIDEGRLWVVLATNWVVGYALAFDLDGQPHLEQVSVLPEWSGVGFGRALIDEVAWWASQRAESLTLSTFRDVEWNAPLYAHLGFEVVPEEEVLADPRLVAVRKEEVEHGLDPTTRVFMRLAF